MSAPIVLGSAAAVRTAVLRTKSSGDVALVPTMGALHDGHLSLVRAARKQCKTVVTSIFVNPTQFGPNEDFARYPRDLDADVRKLQREGVDLVFAPSVDEVYPNGDSGSFVEVPGIANCLDGKSRPGHFRGVATIVAKLFHIVLPDYAFFGQKDAAQVAVLRAMVRDLHFPLELVVCPTMREPDGLAMSSRNQYLSSEERAHAPQIYQSLCRVQRAVSGGLNDAAALRALIFDTIQRDPIMRLEYAEVVDPNTLQPVEDVSRGALVAVAARIGRTRLIDNLLLQPARTNSCE
jgi:pantoate--beta-alanine ligase